MQVEIYSGGQYDERAYAEDCYEEDLFDDDGHLINPDGYYVLAWDTPTTQHLSDATVHGPHLEKSEAVEQAAGLAALK